MTSTYSDNKSLELPGYNDYVDSWNIPLNADMTVLDKALGGSTLLNATSVSGTVTLTSTQYQPLSIIISGTPTGNVYYTIPSGVGGQWTVTNNTTGSYSVYMVSAAGGAGMEIRQGYTTIVSCDGSSSGMRFSINTPPLAAGSNTQVQLNASGILGASANLTFDGTTLALTGSQTISNNLTVSGSETVTGSLAVTGTITGGAATAFVPSGALMPYAGSSAPTGWLLAAGQAVSRTTYAALFAAVGTTYGNGDGSTTFNLPDLRGRSAFGRDDMNGTAVNRITNAVSGITGTTLGATGGDQNLATHTHTVTDPGHGHTVNDPGHTHTVVDPGHVHAPASGTNFWGNNGTGSPTGQPTGGGFNSTGSTTASATTGISNTANTTGITNATNTTGISVSSAGTGSSANIPPAIILNYIIKT